jgi:hydrogenase maturation factor
MSRLHQVVGFAREGRVVCRDLDGREHELSLMAYEGPVPRPGDWLVAQSGFALSPSDFEEAETAMAELRAARSRGTT